MKQKSEAGTIAEAVRHSTGNRQEIEASKFGGCLSCCTIFDTDEITDWRDDWTTPEKKNRAKRWTAQCPRCGKPTVIGSSTGLLDDQAYLPVLNHMLASRPTKRS